MVQLSSNIHTVRTNKGHATLSREKKCGVAACIMTNQRYRLADPA